MVRDTSAAICNLQILAIATHYCKKRPRRWRSRWRRRRPRWRIYFYVIVLVHVSLVKPPIFRHTTLKAPTTHRTLPMHNRLLLIAASLLRDWDIPWYIYHGIYRGIYHKRPGIVTKIVRHHLGQHRSRIMRVYADMGACIVKRTIIETLFDTRDNKLLVRNPNSVFS